MFWKKKKSVSEPEPVTLEAPKPNPDVKGNIISEKRKGRATESDNAIVSRLGADEQVVMLYKARTWLNAVVRKLARTAASTWIEIVESQEVTGGYAKASDANRRRLKNFLDFPNPDWTQYEIALVTLTRLALIGEAWLEITLDGLGYPANYYLIDGSVKIISDEHGKVKSYEEYSNGHVVTKFAPGELIHFRIPDVAGGLHGENTIESLLGVIKTDIFIDSRNRNLAEKAGQGRDFKLPTGTSKEEAERNKAEIYAREKSGETIVYEGDVEAISREGSTEAQFTELSKIDLAKIAAVFGMPVSKVTSLYTTAKTNYDEDDKQFYYETVLPLLKLVCDKLNHFINRSFGFEDWVVAPCRFVSKSLKDITSFIRVLASWGLASANEMRAIGYLPSKAGADLLLKPYKDGQLITNEITGPVDPPAKQSMPMLSKLDKAPAVTPKSIGDDYYLGGVEYKLARELIEIYDKIGNEVIKNLREIGEKKGLDKLDDTADEVGKFVVKDIPAHSDEVAEALAKYEEKGYIGGARSMKDYGPAFQFNQIDPAVVKAIEKHSIELADQVLLDLAEGKDGIKQFMTKAVAEGKNTGLIAEEFAAKSPQVEQYKVARIARTEPARAYNQARLDTSTKAGVKKFWILLGGDPCDWCQEKATECGAGKDIDWINTWMAEHHPTQTCSVVPVVE